MASLLTPLLGKGWVKNYLDNSIIFAPTFSDLFKRLKELFSLFTDNGVKLNFNKRTSRLKEITSLSHRVSAEASKPDHKNVEVVTKMRALINVKKVRRFLGMCEFYRKHVSSFAKQATLLTNLTKPEIPFVWTAECQKVFEQLKSCLIKAPILVKTQIDKPTHSLRMLASNTHVGGVLS